jgi:hypothetical protein
VIEKKERAYARKEKKKRKSVSPRAPKKKSIASKSRKVAPTLSDEDSSDSNAGEEIPMYDQKALLEKPYQTPSPAKI